MKSLTKTRLFKPISQVDIEKFELENSVELPNYLREFFYNYNGSKLLENVYYADNRNYIISILPLIKNEFDTSVEEILLAVRDIDEGIGRKDLIPFATDPGGRPLYISIGGKDIGVVYYDIVGLGEETSLRKIANSFEEFINGLVIESDSTI